LDITVYKTYDKKYSQTPILLAWVLAKFGFDNRFANDCSSYAVTDNYIRMPCNIMPVLYDYGNPGLSKSPNLANDFYAQHNECFVLLLANSHLS
jgi:hypothetical protein